MATLRNTIVGASLSALTANTERAIEWKERDEHAILVINSSSSTTLTVKAGNALQGVNDLELSVPSGISLVKLESGRFKNVSGTNAGKIVVVSAGTPSVGVVALI